VRWCVVVLVTMDGRSGDDPPMERQCESEQAIACYTPTANRPRSLQALTECSDPPDLPKSFRPSEICRDFFVGGIRDCKDLMPLVMATKCRLVVRACDMRNCSRYEIFALPKFNTAGQGSQRTVRDVPTRVPCSGLDDFLERLSGALVREMADPANGHVFAVGVVTLLGAEDEPTYNLQQHWRATSTAIAMVWEKLRLPVVVHCAAGVSRSGAVVVAFLLAHCALGDGEMPAVGEVVDFVRRRRFQVSPNPGFMSQLECWRAELLTLRQS
jgi:hypothetical protein